jgi:signal transduction histidine kinase/CheY-like chemotaxis protein
VAGPISVILLTAIASWLSTRNLYTALAWSRNSTMEALRRAEQARDRQSELQRALKALDEASYRIRRMNYQLALARDQAEEARRLKSQFAASISHELRTPLNLIVGFTELMFQSPEYYGARLPPNYLRDLGIVYRNALHLQGLVDDVLDLSRIEAARMGLFKEETDPRELIREVADTARSLVDSRGLTLHLHIPENLPPLWIDPLRVRQVLFNLLNNAARFTEQGSVTVKAEIANGSLLVSVEDTGVGIAPKDIPKVFEEFRQLDSSTRRRQGGAGLGLAISRHFVQLHGGRIWVDSEPGRGSTFSFTLPLSRGDAELEPPSHGSSSCVPSALETERDRVLLAVTSSPAAANLLNRYVEGYRTIVAQDLHQAREWSGKLIPQGVVVDTTSGCHDSEELRRLAEEWGLQGVPFIACPLPGEEPLRQRMTVDGYLVKPVTRRNLLDTLRQFGEDVETILVIDDDHDFVQLMGRMLDSPLRPYRVLKAYGGYEGLQVMQHRRPDLVLLDLMLPDLDGREVLQQMRSDPVLRGTPVVIVSARGEMEDVGELSGVIMVTKGEGFQPGELVRCVRAILDSSSLAWA